jgi:hypothetical protein
LIAPRVVWFYNRSWRVIGRKDREGKGASWSLTPIISQLTAIPNSVLEDSQTLRNQSITQKMSWAAKRRPTRIEDIAYSVIGLFGVNMPLLYREDSRAFVRLQEEIIKSFDDQTIFKWGFLRTPYPLHFRINTLFASSPREFANCGSVVTSVPVDLDTSHYSLTNKGLHVEMERYNLGLFPGTSLGVVPIRYQMVRLLKIQKRLQIY